MDTEICDEVLQLRASYFCRRDKSFLFLGGRENGEPGTFSLICQVTRPALLVTSVTVVILSFVVLYWIHPEFSFQLKGPLKANIKYPPSVGRGF